MTAKDVVEVIEEILLPACPSYDPPNPEALIRLWIKKFAKVDGDILKRAANLHIDRSRFFPGPSEIRALIDEAEYQVGNERASVTLHDLRAEAVELERRFYQDGEFDRARWITLARIYEKLGHEHNAENIRSKMQSLEAR